MSQILFLVHFSATWYLVGLCWLVQRVQYPLMNRVGVERYVAYEQGHVSRIGLVVAPMMLIELATGLMLLGLGDEIFRRPGFLLGIGLLGVLWASTFLVQVPLHNTLARGFDAESHASLVRTNWIRTISWSLRGLLMFYVMLEMLRGEPT